MAQFDKPLSAGDAARRSSLTAKIQRRYWERWNDDNRDAIDAYNARIAQEGLPLTRYRGF